MAIGTDFEIQNDKDIRYIGAAHGASGAGYYTVIEFHRWLQGLADDASISGDDYMDITRDTPSDRSTDNIITLLNSYNIDAAASEHLYDGSIIQGGASTTIWDGLKIIAAEGMDLQIVQNGAVLTNDFWNTIPYGESTKGLNRDVANGLSHRFMLQIRTTGTDIDGRRIICQTREWGKTYSEFKINGTSRGNNVAALSYASDLNNDSVIDDIAAMVTITNETEGYVALDVDNDSTDEYYYSEWNKATYTINDLYERMKWLTRTGSASTLYGLNGELFRGITHDIPVHNQGTSDFTPPEAITWTGGAGQLLAVNDVNNATRMWIQLCTGVAPTDTQVITGTSSAAYADVNGTVTERSLSQPFCGASTGSALIGSYGFCLEVLDLSQNDMVFDLEGDMYQAPNYVTFTVGGLVATHDYVIAAPNDTGAIDYDQMTLNGALTGPAVTSVVVNGTIPSDTPTPSGTIRILRASGKYTRHPYSAYSGSTFTITEHDFSGDNAANGANVFVSYIDTLCPSGTTLAYTSVYSGTPRSLFIRVRDGGASPIKTYETTGSLGAASTSMTINRISDE